MGEIDNEVTRDRIVSLAFQGDEARFRRFVDELRAVVPPDAQVILRGSAVTGSRWSDGKPFDADGPGTSDLDVTFVSAAMVDLWQAFYIPGLHTMPHDDDNPDACPPLNALRSRLQELAGRPVNLQASSSLVHFARDVLLDQPYYTLIDHPA
ncbi:MAG: hypothetical protein ACT443_16055 [Gemmatimonadota bacterium]